MNDKIKEWVGESIANYDNLKCKEEHIDFFFDKRISNNINNIKLSVDVYLKCVCHVKDISFDEKIMVLLSIPFNGCDGILPFDGHYYLREREPPSIYLFNRNYLLFKKEGDFYNTTVKPFDKRLDKNNFHSYYSCKRFATWEREYYNDYSRSIVVEHYPDTLL